MELLIIAGVISLFAGPTALRKIMQAAQQLNQVKSDFTGPGVVRRLLDTSLDEDQPDGRVDELPPERDPRPPAE